MARPGVSVEVKGLSLVQRNMERVAHGYPGAQRFIDQRIGQNLVQRARSKASVNTGKMRSMIELRSTKEVVEIVSSAWYSHFPHYGTVSGIKADLHLTEALKELEDQIVRDYQDGTEKFIESVWISNRTT